MPWPPDQQALLTKRSAVPGLQNGVRKVILDSYSRTCRKVPKAVLADSLRLDAAAVDELVRVPAASTLPTARDPPAAAVRACCHAGTCHPWSTHPRCITRASAWCVTSRVMLGMACCGGCLP